jgi:hypothetical protein
MQEILLKLIDRYHLATLAAAENSKPMDYAAMACAKSEAPASDAISDWIRKYGISRVSGLSIEDELVPFAKAMANQAKRYFNANRNDFDDPSVASIVKHFAHLREDFGRTYAKGSGKAERKLQSLTAKVLWLRMPDSAPIYDSQAAAAIIFLVKLHKAYAGDEYQVGEKGEIYPHTDGTCEDLDKRWGWPGKLSRETLDNYWYQDFLCSHRALYRQCKDWINERLPEGERKWLTPFRYFDKFLWILGDSGRDYSLMSREMAFRESAGPQFGSIGKEG